MPPEGAAGAARVGYDDAPTVRQREVLALVARGHSSKQIADRLGISCPTVETHIHVARGTLGARTRAQAAALVADDRAAVRDRLERADPLTCEERRLLELLARGHRLGEAADTMHLSRRTADRRLAAARAKLRARTTAEAVLLASGA